MRPIFKAVLLTHVDYHGHCAYTMTPDRKVIAALEENVAALAPDSNEVKHATVVVTALPSELAAPRVTFWSGAREELIYDNTPYDTKDERLKALRELHLPPGYIFRLGIFWTGFIGE